MEFAHLFRQLNKILIKQDVFFFTPSNLSKTKDKVKGKT
jgi:hypothetical protein